MAFDLYFAGARNVHADKYLKEHHANRLQSQLIDRRNIDDWYSNMPKGSKFFIDSGAYTAYTKGISINVDEYIEYLNKYSDKTTIFAQLDTIPGRFNQPKTRDDIVNAPRLSWENYLYMRNRLREPNKLIPIFHQGEDYKWLINMLEWTDENGNHIPYIGVSPATDVPGIESFLDKSFSIIKHSNNPNVKTHAFGMTQLKLLEMYPYTSADSTSWKLCAAMGSIYTPYGTVYVSNFKQNDKNYILKQPYDAQKKLFEYIEQNGYTFNDVAISDIPRYILNIKYLMNWAKNYKFRGVKNYKKILF